MKRFQHKRFPVNIVICLRTTIMKNICERLPLQLEENWTTIFFVYSPRALRFLLLIIFSAIIVRSCPEVFCKKGVLKSFAKFTRKHLCQGPFLIKYIFKVLLKKRLWHWCFPVSFGNFLRTPFFKNTTGGCFWIAAVAIAKAATTCSFLCISILKCYYRKEKS